MKSLPRYITLTLASACAALLSLFLNGCRSDDDNIITTGGIFITDEVLQAISDAQTSPEAK